MPFFLPQTIEQTWVDRSVALILMILMLNSFLPIPAHGLDASKIIVFDTTLIADFERETSTINTSTARDEDALYSTTAGACEDLADDIKDLDVSEYEMPTGIWNLVLRGRGQCADLSSIRRCAHISSLEVHELILDRTSVESILLLQNLKKLTLASSLIGSEEFCLLCSHNMISTLDISDAKIPDTSLICLSHLRNLLDIRLPSNTNDFILNALSKNEKLEKLIADDTKITDVGISQITSLSGLKSLSLCRTAVTGMALKELGQLRNLARVDISDTSLTDETACGLIRLNNVEELVIDRTKCTDKTLSYLSNLPKLRVLSLEGTTITGKGFEHFPNSSSIEQLKLACSSFNEEGLRIIQKFSRLWYLEIQDTDVGENAFPLISRLHNLQSLVLSGNYNESALEDFRKKLPETSIMVLPSYGGPCSE